MNTRHLRAEDLRGLRWRGLVRESTQSQADKWSPERQRNDLARAADELGLVGVEPLYYERTGSGETVGASEITQALADARGGAYDVLLVLHTSRLARNRAEAIRVKQEAAKAGLVLYFVAQRLISGSRGDQLMEGLNEVLDEHANEERRFWISGGIRERQMAGRWQGVVPFGYRRRMADRPDGSRGPDGGLTPDDERAELVRSMFEGRARGLTLEVIAAGTGMTQRQVRDILRNPAYKGVLARYRRSTPSHYYQETDATDGHREVPGDWAPIVDPAVWDRVNLA